MRAQDYECEQGYFRSQLHYAGCSSPTIHDYNAGVLEICNRALAHSGEVKMATDITPVVKYENAAIAGLVEKLKSHQNLIAGYTNYVTETAAAEVAITQIKAALKSSAIKRVKLDFNSHTRAFVLRVGEARVKTYLP